MLDIDRKVIALWQPGAGGQLTGQLQGQLQTWCGRPARIQCVLPWLLCAAIEAETCCYLWRLRTMTTPWAQVGHGLHIRQLGALGAWDVAHSLPHIPPGGLQEAPMLQRSTPRLESPRHKCSIRRSGI